MKRLVILVNILVVLSFACSLSGRAPVPPSPTYPIMTSTATPYIPPSPPPRPDLAGKSLMDVTYCSPDGVDLKMDAYFPPDMSKPVPAAVYVHGGSWRGGDKRSGVGSGEISVITGAGLAVFALNYRLAPQFRFPAMIQDVKCAIRSIRAHAADYGIDPGRIGAFGASAGGHLVSMLGTTDVNAGFDVGEYLDYSSRVQAVVDMCGPADLTLGFRDEQKHEATDVFTLDQVVEASPVTYITPDDPPFLIVQGDKDDVVPPEQAVVLDQRLKSAGVPSTLVMVKNAGHAFTPVGGEMTPSRLEISFMVLQFLVEHLK